MVCLVLAGLRFGQGVGAGVVDKTVGAMRCS